MLKTTNWFFGERERERERKRNGEESDIVILEFLFLALMKEYFEFIGFQFYNTFEVKFLVQIIKFLDCQWDEFVIPLNIPNQLSKCWIMCCIIMKNSFPCTLKSKKNRKYMEGEISFIEMKS